MNYVIVQILFNKRNLLGCLVTKIGPASKLSTETDLPGNIKKIESIMKKDPKEAILS